MVDELLTSSTRLYAGPRALDDPEKKPVIDDFVLTLRSVIEARKRVMVELNVTLDCLEAVVAASSQHAPADHGDAPR